MRVCRRVIVATLILAGIPSVGRGSAWTEGHKRLLLILVDFSDQPGGPASREDATRVVRQIESFYRENSFGRFTLQGTVTPVVRVPLPVRQYTVHGQEIINDARAAARAAGFDTDQYEFDIVAWNTPLGGSGLGAVGGKGVRIVSGWGYSGPVHELGHNLGLPHTRMWVPYGPEALGPGWTWDYGDPYDTMGGGADDPRNHFSIRHKAVLGWLGEGGLHDVKRNGTYRIYAHDQAGDAAPDGAMGIKFPRNARETYWVEFRQRITENVWCMNGVRLHRSFSDNNECELIDAAPDSPHGRDDAALLIGRTYSDRAAGVHVTPLARFQTSPPSVDVVVNAGRFENNRPPVIHNITAVQRGDDAFDFEVDARDSNEDALSYSWDFGDATFDCAKPRTAHPYKERDRDYVVRCVVSDMKGGTASKSIVATVGRPRTHRIAGVVVTDRGRPLEGVRVHVSPGHYVYTDSDGAFTLVGLSTGEHRVTAYKWGHAFAPRRVNAPKGGELRIEALHMGPASFAHFEGFTLESGDRLTLPSFFKPPVEITLEAKTDSNNLRLAYAADQLIFNWEMNGSELRVDGGPAHGQHKPGAGAIPKNRYVTVKWYVTPKKQSVYVDGKLRFEHTGDYSTLERPVSVFTHEAKVTVKSLRVKPLSR